MGALPLSFLKEGPRWSRPLNGFDLPVAYDHAFHDDSAQFFSSRRRRQVDRLGQRQDAGAVRIEGGDPIVVRKVAEGRPDRVVLTLVLGIAKVARRWRRSPSGSVPGSCASNRWPKSRMGACGCWTSLIRLYEPTYSRSKGAR